MEFYILKVCERFIPGIDKPKVKIPITTLVVEKHLKLKESLKHKPDTSIPYMNLVMSLFWTARNYRYDILFAAIFFSTFSHCYTPELYEDCLLVLHYLKNTRQAKLVYKKSDHSVFKIKIMSDASYGALLPCTLFFYLLEWLSYSRERGAKQSHVTQRHRSSNKLYAF